MGAPDHGAVRWAECGGERAGAGAKGGVEGAGLAAPEHRRGRRAAASGGEGALGPRLAAGCEAGVEQGCDRRVAAARGEAAADGSQGGGERGFSLERLAVYDQELVDNKAVRKRYNLDAASSKNQTLRLKLSTRLGAEAADGRVELPHIP